MATSLGGHSAAGPTSAVSSRTSGVFGTQPTAGSVIVVGIGWYYNSSSTDTVTSVTDNAGNTYTRIGTQVELAASGQRSVLYYAKNISTAASFEVTVTFTTNVNSAIVHAAEVKGADTTAPLGVSGGQSQTNPGIATDAVTTGALGTPSEDGHFVYGFTCTDSWPDSFAVGTGYTVVDSIVGNDYSISEYLVQGTAAAAAPTWTTDDAATDPCCSGASFKPAGGGGSPTLELEGYRIRNDDGSESSASWKAAQDTAVSMTLGAARVRVLLDATNDPASKAVGLKYAVNGGQKRSVN